MTDYRGEALAELKEVYQECRSPDWDCYNALPVTKETYEAAREFVLSIPDEAMFPDFGAIPDGSITFEWYFDREHSLTASISQDKELCSAMICGGISVTGKTGISEGEIFVLFCFLDCLSTIRSTKKPAVVR